MRSGKIQNSKKHNRSKTNRRIDNVLGKRKLNQPQSKRIDRSRAVADQFCTPVRHGKDKLIHIQVGRFFDIWVHADEAPGLSTMERK